MNEKVYIAVSGIIFALIAILQLMRALSGLPVRAGNVEIPLWPSWTAVVVAGYLAISGLFLLKRK